MEERATPVEKKQTSSTNRSRDEERVNAITHGLGCVLSFVGLVFLIFFAARDGDAWHILGAALFGGSLVIMYLCSTLYHMEQEDERKQRYRTWDHISIYLVIAGTSSLLTLTVLRGPLGWTLFGVEWGLALLGSCFKLFFGPRFKLLSTLGYVLMGWIVAFAIRPLLKILPAEGVTLLVLGGAFYTLGVPFYLLDKKKKYFHGIWHLFVIAGSGCHFFLGLFHIIPAPGL